MIDLDADRPPACPKDVRRPVVSVGMPGPLLAYIRQQAFIERCSINGWIVRQLIKARDEALPADVVQWLTIQAAQCGCPGDPDRALVLVIRHLADRWPEGGRLH